MKRIALALAALGLVAGGVAGVASVHQDGGKKGGHVVLACHGDGTC